MSKTNPLNRVHRLHALLLVVSAGVCGTATAGSILLTVEAPETSKSYSGTANLRGWAISSVGIDHIDLYIDGVFKSEIPMGAMRNDVGTAFPGYPESSQSGFSMAYNYGNLTKGSHQMTFVAVDNDGSQSTQMVNFQVIGFQATTTQLRDQNVVNYSQATFTASGQSIQIQGMLVQGIRYNATMTWDTESQQFQFSQITQAN